MDRVRVVYEDRWGAILDRVAAGHLELRWFDSTSDMSGAAYRDWLAMFAEEVGTSRRAGVLVDATRFRLDAGHRDAAWSEENVVPLYNASGLRRLAVLAPDGTQTIGDPPRREGAAEFESAYFDRREDALEWLSEGT